MTFHAVFCQLNKETDIVEKCVELSWRLSQIVVTSFLPTPPRRPLLACASLSKTCCVLWRAYTTCLRTQFLKTPFGSSRLTRALTKHLIGKSIDRKQYRAAPQTPTLMKFQRVTAEGHNPPRGSPKFASQKPPLFRNQEKGVFRRGFLQKCTPLLAVALRVPPKCCWAQCPRVFFVPLGVTLDSAETPIAKTPFSWFLNYGSLRGALRAAGFSLDCSRVSSATIPWPRLGSCWTSKATMA